MNNNNCNNVEHDLDEERSDRSEWLYGQVEEDKRANVIIEYIRHILDGKLRSIPISNSRCNSARYFVTAESRYGLAMIQRVAYTLRNLSSEYRFNAYIELGREALRKFHYDSIYIIESIPFDHIYQPGYFPEFDSLVDFYNSFIAYVHTAYVEGDYSKKVAEEKRQLNDHRNKGNEFVDKIFACSANNIVLRIDLEYKEIHQQHVSMDRISSDLDSLLNNLRRNSGFSGRVSYLFAIEYGLFRGFHCHALFVFSSRERNPLRHVGHAKMIGEEWLDVTHGHGIYYNCNQDAEKYQEQGRRGIGAISYYEEGLIANLKEKVLPYFFKSEQMVRKVDEPKVRSIRFGQVPEPLRVGRRLYETNNPAKPNDGDVEHFDMEEPLE